MRRRGSKSKSVVSDTTDTDSSATESDSSATKTDSDMVDNENDDASSPSSDSCPFAEGEKVIAFHNHRLYAAKVTNIRYKMEWEFYVHYLQKVSPPSCLKFPNFGFMFVEPRWWTLELSFAISLQFNWDEWVGVDRLMKNTEENRKKQEAIKQKQGADKNAKLKHMSQTKPKSYHASRGKKRKNDSVNKDKDAIPMEDLLLQMPQPLKKQLVDDCEFITDLGKLVKLPRTPNVNDIFKKYLDYRSKKDSIKKAQSIEEILKGLCCYFDKALPAMLLYKNERQQYEKAITDDVSPSSVYGAEHLLRLFVKLPELLLDANIEEETLKVLQKKLVDFLKFLQKNQSAFFLSTYHVPDDIETSTNKPGTNNQFLAREIRYIDVLVKLCNRADRFGFQLSAANRPLSSQKATMFLVFLLFLTINSPTSSSTSDILSRASSLSVEKPEDVLISPDGVFTAVFHQVGNNSYCFAVWFSEPSPSSDSHQNPTVVWKANLHRPVNGKRSKLSLNPPQLRQSGFTKLRRLRRFLLRAEKGDSWFQRRDWERWGGVVYKGTLSDQRVAAIKQLNAANQGEAEFLAEVSLTGKLYERNLIEMWGYCGEDNHRLLVYEILVPWPRSHLPMCLVGSKGLAYLHEECFQWVLHCDNPKVADFGLSNLLNRSELRNSKFSRIRETRGLYGTRVGSQHTHRLQSVTATGLLCWKCSSERTRQKVFNHQQRDERTASFEKAESKVGEPGRIEILMKAALQSLEEDKGARPTMSVEYLTS
ncbi:unnamed protein product [Malus baccata var. baccata]